MIRVNSCLTSACISDQCMHNVRFDAPPKDAVNPLGGGGGGKKGRGKGGRGGGRGRGTDGRTERKGKGGGERN